MLQLMDKISVLLAAVILGYLAYTTMEKSGFSIETEKELPDITKKMLNPKLIEPNDHASPVGRDPFKVDWATYFDISEMAGAALGNAAAGDNTLGATGQETTTKDVNEITEEQMVFSKKLMGILTSGHGRDAALIDGRVYQVGSLIDGTDPNTSWKVVAIKKDEVVVSLGKANRHLRIDHRSIPRHTPEPNEPQASQEVEK